MEQMIEKNRLLKEARDDMYEIYTLARVLRHADAPDELYKKLVQTIVDKIALTSYDKYDKYDRECKLGLPEEDNDPFLLLPEEEPTEEEPTEEEMAASREVNGDD